MARDSVDAIWIERVKKEQAATPVPIPFSENLSTVCDIVGAKSHSLNPQHLNDAGLSGLNDTERQLYIDIRNRLHAKKHIGLPTAFEPAMTTAGDYGRYISHSSNQSRRSNITYSRPVKSTEISKWTAAFVRANGSSPFAKDPYTIKDR